MPHILPAVPGVSSSNQIRVIERTGGTAGQWRDVNLKMSQYTLADSTVYPQLQSALQARRPLSRISICPAAAADDRRLRR